MESISRTVTTEKNFRLVYLCLYIYIYIYIYRQLITELRLTLAGNGKALFLQRSGWFGVAEEPKEGQHWGTPRR